MSPREQYGDDDIRHYTPGSQEVRSYAGFGAKWLIFVIGGICLLGFLIGLVGFVGGWFDAGKDVISPTNVKTQFHDAYTRHEDLKAIVGNVCDARKLVASEADPSIKAQRQDQEIAQEQNYRRVAALYDAAYDNAFEAKHVGPRDLPRKAETLDEALNSAGCS